MPRNRPRQFRLPLQPARPPASLIESKPSHHKTNLECARIILSQPHIYGEAESLMVEWARRFLFAFPLTRSVKSEKNLSRHNTNE